MSVKEILRKNSVSSRLPPLPQTWKPSNSGDWLFGEVVRVMPHPFDKNRLAYIISGVVGGSAEEPKTYPIQNPSEYMIPRYVNIYRIFEELKVSAGDVIYIEYIESRKIKGGRSVKDFIITKMSKEEAIEIFSKPAEKKAEVVEMKQEKIPSTDDLLINFVKSLVSYYGDFIRKDKFIQLLERKGFDSSERTLEMLSKEGIIELVTIGNRDMVRIIVKPA